MNHFTIDYSEYYIAEQFQKDFPKSQNYSVSIPLSRQQKYYDLLLHNGNNKKSIAIQVKSSRTYINHVADFPYYGWLNNFSITNNHSDFYFIFLSYPIFDLKTFRPKTSFGVLLLVFGNEEMATLLANINKTKAGNADKFFAFVFDIEAKRIYGDRGFEKNPRREFTSNLYHNKLNQIKAALQ
jgi:hypothetical protein